jgi:uncharacterized protein
VTDDGNFEGYTILSVVADPRALASRFKISENALSQVVERSRERLYAARAARIWPGLDDKILTSWNGLMVRGVAEAARAFGHDAYKRTAIDGAEFLFGALRRDGRVFRSYKNGEARVAGYLEDYASLGVAALSVYELTFDVRWLDRAREMARAMTEWFWDDATETFYDTASDHEPLITRPREIADNAVPSGTSLAVELLIRLAEVLDDPDARRRAAHVIETLAHSVARYPAAFGHLLGSADMLVNGAVEVAIVGQPGSADFIALERAAAEHYVPALVLVGGRTTTDIALLAGRSSVDGKATAYVCRNYACDTPAMSPQHFAAQLEAIASG